MSLKSKRLDILFFIVGSFLVAISVSVFTAPNDIAAGGFTGVATILHSLFNIPIGNSVLLLNIPVFIIGANKFGLKFMYKSIVATIIMTVLIDLSALFLPVYRGEKIICSIFGGLIMGAGLGIILLRGATTGGVDIIAKLIASKYSQFTLGNIILLLDAIVIVSSAVVYKNIDNALFAIVAIFVQSKTIDMLLYGSDRGRLVLVKSEHCEEILKLATKALGRIPSFIDNESEKRNIILCATHRFEVAKFHKIVKSIDKTAFMVTMEVGEIFGEGFTNYNESS